MDSRVSQNSCVNGVLLLREDVRRDLLPPRAGTCTAEAFLDHGQRECGGYATRNKVRQVLAEQAPAKENK